ncbi:MAG: arsenic efflux protein, partial [Clostridiales bacterium]|nr:arsenic efflux protein [Clostridiales bacterium]
SAFGVEKIVALKRAKTIAPAPAPAPPTENADVQAQSVASEETTAHADTVADAHDGHAEEHHHDHDHDHEHEHDHAHEHGEDDVEVHIHGCHHHALEENRETLEGASKRQKAAHVWNVYLKHPLLHTATVILYIFIVNVVFGVIVHYVGEDRLSEFVSSTGYLQPVLAALVGLVPNCAGSVVITEMYIVGGLNLGGAVAGLCVSAGIGYAVLAKQNRPIKNTVLIIALMYALSVVLGICVTACGF